MLILTPVVGVSLQSTELVMLALVMTLGMSHGSLDWLLAHHWGLRNNFSASILFFFVYVLMVLISLSVWWILPSLGLVIFLMMSWVHFASDWEGELSRIQSLMIGLAIVSLPTIHYHQDVISLFGLLVSESSAAYLTQILMCLAYASIIVVVYNICQHLKSSPMLALELFILLLIGYVLPPIIYFGLYFCLLHTTKHWQQMKKIGVYQHSNQALWAAVWPTALSGLMIALACHYSTILTFNHALIRAVFISLAVLTVPHWALLEIFPKFYSKLARPCG
jgi:Brp/Blh family beta-carotene 15,15'-monooxygenase